MRKLLPPHLVFLLLAVAVPLGLMLPIAGPFSWPLRLAGLAPVGLGLALTVPSALHFERIGTNIMTFNDPGLLVTSGHFRFTRNPMYLGFLLVLIGAALLVGSLSVWLAPVVFWIAAQFWYIPFEEQRMEATFGSTYDAYRGRVRRWIGTR